MSCEISIKTFCNFTENQIKVFLSFDRVHVFEAEKKGDKTVKGRGTKTMYEHVPVGVTFYLMSELRQPSFLEAQSTSVWKKTDERLSKILCINCELMKKNH